MNKQIIPIFFSSDDNYIPFLSVAINSLISNASKEYNYEIIILNSGLSSDNIKKISKYDKENIKRIVDNIENAFEYTSVCILNLMKSYYKNYDIELYFILMKLMENYL